jgi:hypothetical protein
MGLNRSSSWFSVNEFWIISIVSNLFSTFVDCPLKRFRQFSSTTVLMLCGVSKIRPTSRRAFIISSWKQLVHKKKIINLTPFYVHKFTFRKIHLVDSMFRAFFFYKALSIILNRKSSSGHAIHFFIIQIYSKTKQIVLLTTTIPRNTVCIQINPNKRFKIKFKFCRDYILTNKLYDNAIWGGIMFIYLFKIALHCCASSTEEILVIYSFSN